ncbi:hypothetical protein JCM19241_74 [Vibrio ishigakensis]|uniref:Uncharacterized protein n=1 Tax=Vibrio ishigakensis TaxID=1481914 RepID=A0A0B8QJS5_9VIBR|nr:hypothetical protein JCM19241_74 [Vibrio ishigakensis]
MKLSNQAVGIGLRHPHLDHFEANPTMVPWFEVHSENFFEPNSHANKQLHAIRANTEVSCHGIGLSLGSVSRVNQKHLTQLQSLIASIEPILVSDHLSWSENGGVHFNDLLPLPYTEEALEVFCRNVLEVQDAIKHPLLIENPSSYLKFNHSTIDEWEFLNQVQQKTDCKLLFDLNNIYVSSLNHGYEPKHYIDSIRHQHVEELHLAGFISKDLPQGKIWIDTHSRPVSDEVWQLYRYWCEHYGPKPTLIEWDSDIPEPDILLHEANKATQIVSQLLPQRSVS